ncbi:MAG: MFS transporter [Sedimentisphaerales bacterium]|nr:MFS transporter [Sedimentisphaerales bacterium]
MNSPTKTLQWSQLLTVTALHFLADMFVGMVPALLPRLRSEFGLPLVTGAALITTLYIVCNGSQLLVGHLRSNQIKPFFLPLGMILSTSLCLLAFVPDAGRREIWIFTLIVISGFGTGLVHPEGFRAIHALKDIGASTSTAVFMIGGMLGIGMGAWISTLLVARWGLWGLEAIGLISLAAVAVMVLLKVPLAAEETAPAADARPAERHRASFWPIWLMTIPASIATTAIMGLLPTRLEELGYTLEHGGFSNMLFVAGAVSGTLFWATVSRGRSSIGTCALALLLGVPFLLAHLLFMKHRLAAWFLVPGGFCVMAAYPLMVMAARFSRGLNLGGRMALSAGGTWGVASLAFLLIGVLADRWGVGAIMRWTWTGYIASAVIGLYILYTGDKVLRTNRSTRGGRAC